MNSVSQIQFNNSSLCGIIWNPYIDFTPINSIDMFEVTYMSYLFYSKYWCVNLFLKVQLTRVKENLEKVVMEKDTNVSNAQRDRDNLKRVQKQLRESKDEQAELLKREQDAVQKKHNLVSIWIVI